MGVIMSKLIGFVFAACLIGQASFAADGDKLVGTWKLVSYEVEAQTTGQKGPVMGDKPTRSEERRVGKECRL